MTDPLELAKSSAADLATLMPLLSGRTKSGTDPAIRSVSQTVGARAWNGIQSLWMRLTANLPDSELARGAIGRLAVEPPTDQDRAILELFLAHVLRQDDRIAKELQASLSDLRKAAQAAASPMTRGGNSPQVPSAKISAESDGNALSPDHLHPDQRTPLEHEQAAPLNGTWAKHCLPRILQAIRATNDRRMIIQHTWSAAWMASLEGDLEDAVRTSEITSIRLMIPGNRLLALRAASRKDVSEEEARNQLRETTLGFLTLVRNVNSTRGLDRRITIEVSQHDYLPPGPLIQVGDQLFYGMDLPLASSDDGPFGVTSTREWPGTLLTAAWSKEHRHLFRHVPAPYLCHSIVSSPLCGSMARILAAAVDAVCPRKAVKKELRVTDSTIEIGGLTYSRKGVRRVFILGLGKAAVPMTERALEQLSDPPEAALVVTKSSHMTDGKTLCGRRPELGNHPDPMGESEQAGREILKFMERLRDGDLLLCLLSGGGSSLAVVPEGDLSIADVARIGKALRDAGASIHQTNAVRSQIDRLKGGGILRLATQKGARVATIAISDVPGDVEEVIASGPTLPPKATSDDAREVVTSLGLDEIAEEVERALHSREPFEFDHGTCFRIGARNLDAIHAAVAAANREGLQARVLATDLQGNARTLGRSIGRWTKSVAAGKEPKETVFDCRVDTKTLRHDQPMCFVAGGEATVKKPKEGTPEGRGGRTLELAMAIGEELEGTDGVTVVVLATDGDDGNSGTGGAVVTSATLTRANKLKMEAAAYHEKRESFHYFDRLHDTMDHGPTETNVNDLTLIFIERSAHRSKPS